MEIKEEELTNSFIEELKPLLINSAREVYADKNILSYINEDLINFKELISLNKGKYLYTFSIRDDGKLIGYLSFNHHDSQQAPDAFMFTLESMFVQKDKRSYKLFKNILEVSKNKAQELNCISIDFNVPTHLSKIFLRCGYEHIESRFSIDL